MKKIIITLAFMVTIFAFYGCKKISSTQEMQSQKVQRFFETKGVINPVVQRVIDDLRKKNTLTGFAENLASKQGFPVWHKAKVNILKYNTSSAARDFDSTANPVDTIVQIPLVDNDNTVVTSFIQADLNGNIEEKLFSANDYKNYFPLAGSDPSDYEIANKYAMLFMTMQVEVLGSSAFKITDNNFLKFVDAQTGLIKKIEQMGVWDISPTLNSTQTAARKWLVVTLDGGCQELWYNDDDGAGLDDDGWYIFRPCGTGTGGSAGENPGGSDPSGNPPSGNVPSGWGDPWSGGPQNPNGGSWYPGGGGHSIDNPPPYNPFLVGWLSSEDPPNIVNNVIHPCLTRTIKIITNDGLPNEISNILSQVFNLPNSNSNIIFSE